MKPLRYLAHGDFHAALHRRVEAHFARSGVGPGPTPAMWWKTPIIVAWSAASYGLLMRAALASHARWLHRLGAEQA